VAASAAGREAIAKTTNAATASFIEWNIGAPPCARRGIPQA
jgi:hypothetical protein